LKVSDEEPKFAAVTVMLPRVQLEKTVLALAMLMIATSWSGNESTTILRGGAYSGQS
jgi:hypothetical protein